MAGEQRLAILRLDVLDGSAVTVFDPQKPVPLLTGRRHFETHELHGRTWLRVKWLGGFPLGKHLPKAR